MFEITVVADLKHRKRLFVNKNSKTCSKLTLDCKPQNIYTAKHINRKEIVKPHTNH